MESLWHEILHNRAQGAEVLGRHHVLDNSIMEAVNEWVARHSYGDFMRETFGVEAKFTDDIIKGALGYSRQIKALRETLSAWGFTEKSAFSGLNEINLTGAWKQQSVLLRDFILNNSPKIKQMLKGRTKNEAEAITNAIKTTLTQNMYHIAQGKTPADIVKFVEDTIKYAKSYAEQLPGILEGK